MNNKRNNELNDEVVISLDSIERLSKILALSSLRDFKDILTAMQKELRFYASNYKKISIPQ